MIRLLRLAVLMAALCATGGITAQAQSGPRQYITYEPATGNFANPERGFFEQNGPLLMGTGLNPQNVDTLRALRTTKGISMVRWYFFIDEFRTTSIPASTLTFIDSQFQVVRDAGLKVIPRFAYNNPVGGQYPFSDPDATLRRVLEHISQLKPVLQANGDVIAFMEIGFVGAWGEWHSSTNLLVNDDTGINDKSRQIVSALLDAVPANRMIAMRFPFYKQELYGLEPLTEAEAFSGTPKARMGGHNDCFVSSYTDVGTYPEPADQRAAIRAYVRADNRFVPQGGETCSAGPEAWPYIQCTNALRDLRRLRYTTLNILYHPDVLNLWRSQGCFDTIAQQLGYRFRLIEAAIPTRARAGEQYALSLVIQNDGFATPYNPRGFEIVLRSHANGQLYRPTLAHVPDPRRWLPDHGPITVSVQMTLPATLPAGRYDVLLNLPDPAPRLYGRPEYSIRLANRNTWQASTGFNDLLVDVDVEASGSATQLLTNVGFENGLTGWTVQRAAGTAANDSVVCGGVGSRRSKCAWVFTGGTNENTRLSQTVKLKAGQVRVGDRLRVMLDYSTTRASTPLTIRLVGTRRDGQTVSVVLLNDTRFTRTTTQTNGPVYDTLQADTPSSFTAAALTKLQLIARFTAPRGKLYLDRVRLMVLPGSTRTASTDAQPLPLPPAP
jgi:hypothetical protein